MLPPTRLQIFYDNHFRTYVVVSGKEVEPGIPFKVVVTLFKSNKKVDAHFFNLPSTIHAKILRRGTVIAEETRECQAGTTEIIAIKVCLLLLVYIELKF